jgi:hypothetical protein
VTGAAAINPSTRVNGQTNATSQVSSWAEVREIMGTTAAYW